MTTYTKTIQGRAVIGNNAKEKTINSLSMISISEVLPQEIACSPFDSTDFEQVILEDTGQYVEVRKRPKSNSPDETYGFETGSGDKFTTKAIVRPVTERDAKLIESGYAKMGDFKLMFKKNENVDVHDLVYDPMRRITIDLTSYEKFSVVKQTPIMKSFVGVVQSRK